MKNKKLCAGVLAASLIVSSTPFSTLNGELQAADAPIVQMTHKDLQGHKYEALLERWIADGKLMGDDHGQINPDQPITRAELAAFINRVKGFQETTDISRFKDVPKDAWYATEVARAVKAGYLVGMGQDTFAPEGKVTAEQAVAVALRLSDLPRQTSQDIELPTNLTVAPWAKDAFKEAIARGIFSTKDLQASLSSPSKRAENILWLDRSLNKNPVLSVPGSYKLGEVNNVEVQSLGVTIKDTTIAGQLTITAAPGEKGKVVTLENVKVNKPIIAPKDIDVIQDGKKAKTQEGSKANAQNEKKGKDNVTIGGSSSSSSRGHSSSKKPQEPEKPGKTQAESYNELPRIMDWLLNRPITNTELEKTFKAFPKGAKIIAPETHQFTKSGTQKVTVTIEFPDKSTKQQDVTLNVKEKLDDYSGLTVKPIEAIKALDNDRGYVDGVYEGFALGYQKNLYVKVTVQNGKIVAVDKAGDGQIDDGGDYERRGFENVIKTIIDKQDPQSVAAQLNTKIDVTQAMYAFAAEKGHSDEAYKEAMKRFFSTEENAPRGIENIYRSQITAYDAIGKKVLHQLKAAKYDRVDVASGATWTGHGTANAIIDALNKANPKNNILGLEIKGDRVKFDRYAGKDKATGYDAGDPFNFSDYTIVFKKRGGQTETIKGADFAKNNIRVEQKENGKEIPDGMPLTEENIGHPLVEGLELNIVHKDSGVKKELLVLVNVAQKLKQKEFQYRIAGTDKWENLYTPKPGFDRFKFTMPVPESTFKKIANKKIEVRVILEDKKGKQYILQGKPDQAFQVPSTPEETVSMNYGKNALQGGQKEKFDFYDVYTYMFKEVSDNPGESGQLSEAQTALKNEIEKVKGWFASAKFMQVEFDKDKGGPLQEALTKAENGLKSGELSNNELKAEKEALIQAEKDFEAKMRAGIEDTLDVLTDGASQVDNEFIKGELDSLTEELSNLKQSESFSPANIQLAFYKSEKLFHRLDILEELPEAQELHKTRPGNKRLKDAIEAAKNSIEDSRMNNAKLKAIYKELVDAMAEAQAQKPGKLANGEYPSINSVVILTDQDTLVKLPAEIEDRTVTKAVLKKGEEVIAENKYDLDFAKRTLALKHLTASDAGKYTLLLQSDEYEDLELPFELRTGKTIQYTFKGLAHVKRIDKNDQTDERLKPARERGDKLDKTWTGATSYYLVATVTFNDKHEVEKFELNPAVAKEGVDPKNSAGSATLAQVDELTYTMEDGGEFSSSPIKDYGPIFIKNQDYWNSMIYGNPEEDPRTESFLEVIKRKGIKSKADFEGLQTLYDNANRNDKNIDAVSGATISSNAAKEAILDAFSQFEAQFK